MHPQVHPDVSNDARETLLNMARIVIGVSELIMALMEVRSRTRAERIEQQARGEHAMAAAQAAYQSMAADAKRARQHAADEAVEQQFAQQRKHYQGVWKNAFDPAWCARADVVDLVHAWAAAALFEAAGEDHEDACKARIVAEDQLRIRKPGVMALYDSLRQEGLSPAQAMAKVGDRLLHNPYSPGPFYQPAARDRLQLESVGEHIGHKGGHEGNKQVGQHAGVASPHVAGPAMSESLAGYAFGSSSGGLPEKTTTPISPHDGGVSGQRISPSSTQYTVEHLTQAAFPKPATDNRIEYAQATSEQRGNLSHLRPAPHRLDYGR